MMDQELVPRHHVGDPDGVPQSGFNLAKPWVLWAFGELFYLLTDESKEMNIQNKLLH